MADADCIECRNRHFDAAVARLGTERVAVWNIYCSDGDSFYFLNPDGHNLELRYGGLSSQLAAVTSKPYEGWLTVEDESK